MKITRRKLMRLAMAGGLTGLGLGSYAWLVEPHWVEYTETNLTVPGLPDSLAGKTCVQLSDIHVGCISENYLLRQLKKIEAMAPDFVFYTGDFIHDARFGRLDKLIELLPSFAKGKIGTACVLGNHDFYDEHHQNQEIGAKVQRTLMATGLVPLRNDIVEFNGLKVAGLEDLWSSRFRRETAGEIISDLTGPSLVLSHNPDTFDLPIWGDYSSWVLSGHTHGGQCKAPFFAPPMLPVKNRNYVAGAYQVGQRNMYINRGIGHSLKVRFCVRPEISVFRLVSA